MDVMIWVVTIGLIALVGYSIYVDPPSSGCLSADAARARDEALKRERPDAPTSERDEPVIAVPEPELEAEPAVSVTADASEPQPSGPPEVLRNPLTGQTAAIPTNYRFAKKWIKEALVAEGLLDKVYSNRELDAVASAKVKAALKQFRSLAKYRA